MTTGQGFTTPTRRPSAPFLFPPIPATLRGQDFENLICAGCKASHQSPDPVNPNVPRRWGFFRQERPAGTACWYCSRTHRSAHIVTLSVLDRRRLCSRCVVKRQFCNIPRQMSVGVIRNICQPGARNHYLHQGLTWNVLVQLLHDPAAKCEKALQQFMMRLNALISAHQMGRLRMRRGPGDEQEQDEEDNILDDVDLASTAPSVASPRSSGGAASPARPATTAEDRAPTESRPDFDQAAQGIQRIWVPYGEYTKVHTAPITTRDVFHIHEGQIGMLVPTTAWPTSPGTSLPTSSPFSTPLGRSSTEGSCDIEPPAKRPALGSSAARRLQRERA